MQKSKLLLGVIIALVASFIGFKVFQQETLAEYVRPAILPLLTVYYCAKRKDRSRNFFNFLICYSLSELLTIAYFIGEPTQLTDEIVYFSGNILCVIAYSFLILEIFKSIKLVSIIKKFSALIVILLALDVYTVILVSDVANKSEFIITNYEYAMEITYNAATMILLTVALLNYLYRDSNKAMTLLVGSLCIVFSEVIQVAYFYVSEINFLDILYSLLLVIAFLFFYLQTYMSYNDNKLIEHKSIQDLEEA